MVVLRYGHAYFTTSENTAFTKHRRQAIVKLIQNRDLRYSIPSIRPFPFNGEIDMG